MYRTLALIAAAASPHAYFDWPYGYYQLLRFGVCAVGVYGAVLAHRAGLGGWTWGLGALAVLFNPLVPVHFDRDVWAGLDLAAAALLALSARAVPSS